MRGLLLIALLLAASAWQVNAASPVRVPASLPTTQPTATQQESSQLAEELSQIRIRLEQEQTDPATVFQDVERIRNGLLDLDPLTNRPLLRETSFTWRLAQVLGMPNREHGQRVRGLLREHREAATMLLFTLAGESDDPQEAFEILDRLCRQFPRVIDRYANLAAAICVVRDAGSPQYPGVNAEDAPTPEEVFAYFVDHERQLAWNLREMPPELLVFVVDVAASIPELEWSLGRYARQSNVGTRFFDVPYDYEHFRNGQIKEVSQRGYCLQNLQKFGGVCADQAYFAAHVGKSIGIPSAIVVASGSESSHAWIAFLETRGQGPNRESRWNMESGRYDAYRSVRGTVTNPQTNRPLYEGELRVLADLVWVSEQDRLDAIACADMAGLETMANLQRRPSEYRYDGDDGGVNPPSRPRRAQASPAAWATPTVGLPQFAQQEQLLRRAVELSPACLGAWRQVQRLGSQFTLEQKEQWADLLQRLCGRRHPDFAVKVLHPMIASLPGGEPQDRAWESTMRFYGNNIEVAADIRLAQARALQGAGKSELALQRCDQVVRSCSQAGPRVAEALALAEEILITARRQNEVVDWYAQAFDRTIPPRDMAGQFARQSAWYRIGSGYVRWLSEAGNEKLADKISRRLERVGGDTDQ